MVCKSENYFEIDSGDAYQKGTDAKKTSSIYSDRAHCGCVSKESLMIRFDDSPGFYEKRYKTYKEQTQPMINIIKIDYSDKFVSIDAFLEDSTGIVEEVVKNCLE